MNHAPGWNYHWDVHPPGWRFPAGESWIAGWIQPPAGQVVTDVRARLHQRVILGLAGLPHPQFKEPIAGQSNIPRPGFSFLFAPQPGASVLRLEARDQSGCWREFCRQTITTTPGEWVPPATPGANASLSRLVTTLLRRRMGTPERTWKDQTDDLVAAFVAEPLNAHPNVPFVGALEEPRDIGRLRFGRISVTGWLAHANAGITRLTAVIDPQPPVPIPAGPARVDIARDFPALNGHPVMVFAGDLPLPPDLATPILLKLFAELENGEQHLVFARRFTPLFHDESGEIPPLVPARTFARAVWALLRSSVRQAVPRLGWLRSARTIWASYQAMPVYRPGKLPPRSEPDPAPDPGVLPDRPTPAVEPGAHSFPTTGTDGLPTCTLISAHDDMSVADTAQYFHVGRDALRLVQDAVTLAGNHRVRSILDLPCGFGRVGRWLRTAYPEAHLAASDTQTGGVDFCVAHLGAAGVHAATDGRHWAHLTGPYDVIWCGSLLTHFDWHQWVDHLQRFAQRLSPTGVLVFTSHGMLALERLQSGEKDYGLPVAAVARLCSAAVTNGFAYVDYADTPGYGISIAQPGWIRSLIARETELQLLEIRPSAWGQHQDVVVCRRRPAGILFQLRRGPGRPA